MEEPKTENSNSEENSKDELNDEESARDILKNAKANSQNENASDQNSGAEPASSTAEQPTSETQSDAAQAADGSQAAEPSGDGNDKPESSTAPAPVVTPAKKSRRKLYMIILAVLLLLAAGVGYYLYSQSKSKPAATTPPPPATHPSTTPTPPPVTGDTFLQTPVKLADLKFFKDTSAAFGTNCPTPTQTTNCPPAVSASKLYYIQIGATKDKQPIIVVTNSITYSGMGTFTYYAIKLDNGNYKILSKLNPGGDFGATFKKDLSANVSVDSATNISEFSFPQKVTAKGLTLESYSNDGKTVTGEFIDGLPAIMHVGTYITGTAQSSQLVKLDSQDGKDYYEVLLVDKSGYQVKGVYGVVAGVYAVWYYLKTPLEDPIGTQSTSGNNAVKIKWTDGKTNTNEYDYHTAGCSASSAFVVTKGVPDSQLTKAGTMPDGSTVYQLATSNSLFNSYYVNYVGFAKLNSIMPKSLQNLTPAAYQSQHGVIVLKNALGENVVYTRPDLQNFGGCGKPVIYLYPKKATRVDVRVGANITKSDPLYGPYGWQNVLAQPNGSLIYQGKTYDSLFWEGTGLGVYPLLGAGTVVPRAQVVSTIKSQLSEQGFKPHEISDFLAFWQPRLPETPYTRLTWLGTNDMNQLAPLNVSPQPQTVIRTFLDFQGLDQPMQLTPQTFNAPARNGFTVVEWGGLLRN